MVRDSAISGTLCGTNAAKRLYVDSLLLRGALDRLHARGRIRLGDGSLHRLTIEEPFCNDEKDARKYTATTQAEEDAHGRILAAKRGELPRPALATETVRKWSERWIKSREERGNTTTRDDASRLEHHVFPTLEHRARGGVHQLRVGDFGHAGLERSGSGRERARAGVASGLSWLLGPSGVVMPRRDSRGAVRRARGSL
jgi:hypothetical protein